MGGSGLKLSRSGPNMSGSGQEWPENKWEQVGVGGSGWKWMGVSESG